MSDYDEHDPYGETRSAAEASGASGTPDVPDAPGVADPFDAFRARRAQERAEREPFPEQFGSEPVVPAGSTGPLVGPYGGGAYSPLAPPPYEQYTQVTPPTFDESASRLPRRRLRSVIVFGGVVALVVGIGAGVWAATNSSGSSPAAAGGTPSASASASPGSKATKTGKAVSARLTVTSVGSDSFTATTARGESIVVRITTATRFGTAARPFTQAQLVPGAKVVARLRKESDGTVVATVIAAQLANPSGQPTATATASASSAGI